jgi:hypothetical protein
MRKDHSHPPAGMWVYDPAGVFRDSGKKVPADVKKKTAEEAQKHIDSELKPTHIKAAGKNPQFNYIVDLYTKWHGPFFYFCAKYRVPSSGAEVTHFEAKFARLQYADKGRFNLAFRRHNGQWIEVEEAISLQKCLEHIEKDGHFIP